MEGLVGRSQAAMAGRALTRVCLCVGPGRPSFPTVSSRSGGGGGCEDAPARRNPIPAFF